MKYMSLLSFISAVANLYFLKQATSEFGIILAATATIGSILGAITWHPNWLSKSS